MRIALLHLDLSGGPEERNLALLESALSMAAARGAGMAVTPETAVQGYFFTQKEYPYTIKPQPSSELKGIQQIAQAYGLTVFLGCAELDEATGNCYNSCLVVGENGEVIGRHRKIHSHGTGAEGWAAKGNCLEPVECGGLTAGVLVCADAYYPNNAKTLKEKGAQAVVVPAAWPPGGCGGPPVDIWERCSKESGLPVWVCNQTGSGEKMDMSEAQSAVVVGGKLKLAYSGRPAVLLFDWDAAGGLLLSDDFDVMHV